jgi:hypothetical protein
MGKVNLSQTKLTVWSKGGIIDFKLTYRVGDRIYSVNYTLMQGAIKINHTYAGPFFWWLTIENLYRQLYRAAGNEIGLRPLGGSFHDVHVRRDNLSPFEV